MKEKLKELLKKKEEERAALIAKSESSEDVAELRSINTQLGEINADITELRGLINNIKESSAAKKDDDEPAAARTVVVNSSDDKKPENRAASYTPGKGFNAVPGGGVITAEERKKEVLADKEKRGRELMEGRSVTVSSGTISLPKRDSSTINGTFIQVSSLIDSVDQLPIDGGESFRQPYEKDTPDANYTGEGAAPQDTDMTFGYADINKTKVVSYSEITNEVKKLPAADYESVIMQGVTRSVRKKLTKDILVGDGTTNHLVGIFSDKATAINPATDVEIGKIDNTTLNNIIFSYGGDEAVEDQAVLILNKLDLKAFSQLRTTDGKPFHTIVSRGNSGTIDGIPYIINSAAAPISKAETTAGAYCMAYGNLSNYKLVIFSDLDVERSTDYKFKEGMIAHRAEIYAGGNVVSYNGFVRIKKAAVV